MMRPAAFGFNPETARTNAFQRSNPAKDRGTDTGTVQELAIGEFDTLARSLRDAGCDLIVLDDQRPPPKPDAVFVSNWISFHPDGTVILYPMLAPNRRLERRPGVIADLEKTHGFRVTRIVDLTSSETESKFLEGTGSLVFDHREGRVYASRSPRTDTALARRVATLLDCDLVDFETVDPQGRPIYHTNVVLALGTGFAVIAADSIPDLQERETVLESIEHSGREVIRIDWSQVSRFAGNLLEAPTRSGDSLIVMSTGARDALSPVQLEKLEAHGRIAHVGLETIEQVGGGSARCMIADIHLPR